LQGRRAARASARVLDGCPPNSFRCLTRVGYGLWSMTDWEEIGRWQLA